MSVAKQFEANNKEYVSQFTPELASLALPPAKQVAVIACMDARLLPTKVLGIKEGESHIIRNAGGRAADALRSVIISQRLLGTREIVIVHHTDCGMLTFTDNDLRSKLRLETGQVTDHLSFLPFADLDKSVKDDVEFLKLSELVLDVPISGYVYDVKTGAIRKVE